MMKDDRFELLEEIGSGPLGRVLRARDRATGQTVALRLIAEPDAGCAAALVEAARCAATVTDPHVVRVLDGGRDGETVWVAMELLSGRSLARVLQQDGPFGADRLLQVGVEICLGLEAHHRVGLVHRDLKPANVLLTSRGAKIIDVGLAHARARAGTHPYVSPEARHGYPVDERSDLYSLGVLLYELATGTAYEGPVDVPVALPSSLPPGLNAVILRLLHLDRYARYHSAAAVAAALTSAAKLPERRGRWKLAVAGVAAVAAVAAAVLALRC